MDPTPSFDATPQSWLLDSVLAPHAAAYVAYLSRGRYAATTIKGYLASIAHFARWMTACYLPVRLLDEHTVEQFLGNHVPRCDCPAPVMRVHDDLRAALGHLLDVLREEGLIAEAQPPTGYIAEELQRYDEHMRAARGLTAGTRRGRLRTVQRLLLHQFAGRPVAICELQPDDVRGFMAAQPVGAHHRADTVLRRHAGQAVGPALERAPSSPGVHRIARPARLGQSRSSRRAAHPRPAAQLRSAPGDALA